MSNDKDSRVNNFQEEYLSFLRRFKTELESRFKAHEYWGIEELLYLFRVFTDSCGGWDEFCEVFAGIADLDNQHVLASYVRAGLKVEKTPYEPSLS